MAPTDTSSFFPSETDHQRLLQAQDNGKGGLDKSRLSTDDRWFWHAYDYGWRRTYLLNRNPVSPIDPHGDWFDPHLADEAERMYARKLHRKLREGDTA